MSSTEDGGYSKEFTSSKGRSTRSRLQKTSQPLKRRSQRHLKPARTEEAAAQSEDSSGTRVPGARGENASESHVDKANNQSDVTPCKPGPTVPDLSSSSENQEVLVNDRRDDLVKPEVEPGKAITVMTVGGETNASKNLDGTSLKCSATNKNCEVPEPTTGEAKSSSQKKHNKSSSGSRSCAAQREVDIANICLNTRRPKSINMTPDVTMKGLCDGISSTSGKSACDSKALDAALKGLCDSNSSTGGKSPSNSKASDVIMKGLCDGISSTSGKSVSDLKKRAANHSPEGSSRKILRLENQNPDIGSQRKSDPSVSVSSSHQLDTNEKCSLLGSFPSKDNTSDGISRSVLECTTRTPKVTHAVIASATVVSSSEKTALKSLSAPPKVSAAHVPGSLLEGAGLKESSLSSAQSGICAATKTDSSVYENIINNNHISNKDIAKSMNMEPAVAKSATSKTQEPVVTGAKEMPFITDQSCLSAEEALLSFGSSQNPPDFLALCNLSPPYSRALECNFPAQLPNMNSSNMACFVPAVSLSGSEAQQKVMPDSYINPRLTSVSSSVNDRILTSPSIPSTASDVLHTSSPSQEPDNYKKPQIILTDKKSNEGCKLVDTSSASLSCVATATTLSASAPSLFGGSGTEFESTLADPGHSQSCPSDTSKPYGLENSCVCTASKIAVVHPSLQSFSVGGSKTPQFFTPSHMTVPSATVAVSHSCVPVAPAIGCQAAPQPPLFNMLTPAPFFNVLSSQIFDSNKTPVSSSFCAPVIPASNSTQASFDCSSAAAANLDSEESRKFAPTNSPLSSQPSLGFVAADGVPPESALNLNSVSDCLAPRAIPGQLPLSTEISAFGMDVPSGKNVAATALPKRCKLFSPHLSLPLGPSLKKLRDQQALDSVVSVVKLPEEISKSNTFTESNKRLNNLASLSSPACEHKMSAAENVCSEPTTRIPMATINSHFICSLCNGYFVDATTIVVCFHSFCRACIVRYLEHSVFCPVCEVLLHSATPTSKLRPDPQLQALLYAILPELYCDELLRRRAFYKSRGIPPEASPENVPALHGLQALNSVQASHAPLSTPLKASPTTPSASCPTPFQPAADTRPAASPEWGGTAARAVGQRVELGGRRGGGGEQVLPPLSSALAGRMVCSGDLLCVQLLNCHLLHTQRPRYLQCPAMVTMGLLKRLLRAKFSLSQDESVLLLVPDLVHMQKRSRSSVTDPSVAARADGAASPGPCGEVSVAVPSGLHAEGRCPPSSSSSKEAVTTAPKASTETVQGVCTASQDSDEHSLVSTSGRSGTTEPSVPDKTKCEMANFLPEPGLCANTTGSRSLVPVATEDRQEVQSLKGGNSVPGPVPNRVQARGDASHFTLEDNIGQRQSTASCPSHCQGILLLDLETLRDAAYLQNWQQERPIKIFYKIIHHSKRRHGSESSKVIDRKELLTIPCDLINSAQTVDTSTAPSSCAADADRLEHAPDAVVTSSAPNDSVSLGENSGLNSVSGGRASLCGTVVRPVPAAGVAILPKPENEKPALPEDCLQKWRNVQAQQLQKLEKVVTSNSSKPKGAACPSSSHNKTEVKTKVSSANKAAKLSTHRGRSRNLPVGGKEGKKSGDVMGVTPSITSIARGASGSIYSQSLNGVTMRSAPTNASLNAISGDSSAGLVISALSHQQLLLLQDQQQLAQFQQLSQVQHLYSFQRLQQQPLSQGFTLDDGSSNCISQKSLLASSILPAINSDAKPSNSVLPSPDVSNLLAAGLGGSHLNFSGLSTDPSGLFFAAGGVSSNVLNTLSGGSIASPALNMNAFAPFNLGYGIMPLVSTPNVLGNGGGLTLLNSSGSLQAIVSGSGQSLDPSNSLAPPTLLATDGTGFMNIGASAVTPDISGLALQGATILPFGIPFGQSTGSLFCLGTNTHATTQNNDTLSPLTIVPVSSEADDVSDCSTTVSSITEPPLTGSAMTLEDCLNIAGVTSVVDPNCSNSEAEPIATSSVVSPYAPTSTSNCVPGADSSALPYSVQPAIQYLDKAVSSALEPALTELKTSVGITACSPATSSGPGVSVAAGEASQSTSVLSESEWKEVQLKISETGIMSVSAGDDQSSVMESLLDQVESESSQLLLSSIESTSCGPSPFVEAPPRGGHEALSMASAEPASTASAEEGSELLLTGKASLAGTSPVVPSSSSAVRVEDAVMSGSAVSTAASTCLQSCNFAGKTPSPAGSADFAVVSANCEKIQNSTDKSANADKSCSIATKCTYADKDPKINSTFVGSGKTMCVLSKSPNADVIASSSPLTESGRNSVKSSNIISSTSVDVGTAKGSGKYAKSNATSTVGGLVPSVRSKPVILPENCETRSKKSGTNGTTNSKSSIQNASPLNSSAESSPSTSRTPDQDARPLQKDSKEISDDVQSDDELPPLKVCESVKRHSSEDMPESSKKVKLEVPSLPPAVPTTSPITIPSLNKEERPMMNRKTSKLKEIAEKQRSLTTKSNDCNKKDRVGDKGTGSAYDGKSRHIPLDVAAATISANLKSLSKLTAKSQLPSTVGGGASKKQDGKGDQEKLGRKSHSVGYKTLNTSPKGWNPTISKEQFQLGVSNVGLPKTNKFFKARNAPRLLSSSSLSVLKASVSGAVVETTSTASNSKIKNKKLNPVSKPDLDKSTKSEIRNSDELKKKDAASSSPSSKPSTSSNSPESASDTSKNLNTSPKLPPSSADSRISSKVYDAKQKLVHLQEVPSVSPRTPTTSTKVMMKTTSSPKSVVASHAKASATSSTKTSCSPESREKRGPKAPALTPHSPVTVPSLPSSIASHSEINSASTLQENKLFSDSGWSPPKAQETRATDIKESDSLATGMSRNACAVPGDQNAAVSSETSNSEDNTGASSNLRCLRSFHKKLEAAKYVDPGIDVKSVISTASSLNRSETSVVDSNVGSEMPLVIETLTKTKPQAQSSKLSFEHLPTSVKLDHTEAGTSVKANFAGEPLKSAFQSTVSREPDASVTSASKDVSVNFDRAIPATVVKSTISYVDNIASALAIKNSIDSASNADTALINLTVSSSTLCNSRLLSSICNSPTSSSATVPVTTLPINSVSSRSSASSLISGNTSTVPSNALVTPIISSGVAALKKTTPSLNSLTTCGESSSTESVKSVSLEFNHSTKNISNSVTSVAVSTSASTTAISSVESSNITTISCASVGVPSSPCKTNSSHDIVVVTSSVDRSVNSFISSKEVGTTVKSTSCIISSISCVSVNDESSSGRCQTNSSSKGPSIVREKGTPSAGESAREEVAAAKGELKEVDKSVLHNNEKPCSVPSSSSSSSSVSTQSTHLMVPSVPLVPVSNRSFANHNVNATTIKAKKSNKNQDALNSDQAIVSKVKSSDSANTLTVAQSAGESTDRGVTTSSVNEPCSFVSNKSSFETTGRRFSSTTVVPSNPNTVVTQASNASTTASNATQSSDNPFSHFNPNYYMPYSLYHGSIAPHANSSYPYLSSSLNYYNQGVPANSSCDTNTSSSGEQSCRNLDSRQTAVTWNDANYNNLYNTKISQTSSPTTSHGTQGNTYTQCSSTAQSQGVSHSQNASIIANLSSTSVQSAVDFKSNKSTVSSSSTLANCHHENSSQATHFSACSLKSSAVSSALSSPPKASLPHVYSPNIPSSHSLSQSSSSGQTSVSNISPRNRANTSCTENSQTQMSSNHRTAKNDKMQHFDPKAGSPCSMDSTDASSSGLPCSKESAKKTTKVNQAVASAKKVPTTSSNKNTPCTTPSLDSHNQMLQNYPMLNSPSYALSNFMSQNAFQQATPNFFDPFSAYGFSRGISSTGQSSSVGLGNNYSDFHNTANRTSDMSSYDYSGGSAIPKTCSDTRSTSQYYPYNAAGYFNSSSASTPSTHHDSSNTMSALNAYLSNINNSHSYPGYAMAANFHYLMPNSFPMNMMQSSWNSFQLAKGSGSMSNSLDSSQYGNSSSNSYSGFYYNQNMGYPSSSFMGNAGSYNNYPYLPMPPFSHFSASQTAAKTTQVPQSPSLHTTQANSPASNKAGQKSASSTSAKTYPSMASPHFDSRVNSVSKIKRQSNSAPIDASISNTVASCESLLSACASGSFAASTKSRSSNVSASPGLVPLQPRGHTANLKESTVQAVTDVLSSLAQLAPTSFDSKTLAPGNSNSKFLPLPASSAHSKTNNQNYLSMPQAKKDILNTSKRVSKVNTAPKGSEDKSKDISNSDSISKLYGGFGSKETSVKQITMSDPTNLSVDSKPNLKCTPVSSTTSSANTCSSSQYTANSSKISSKLNQITESNSPSLSNENSERNISASEASISNQVTDDLPSNSKNSTSKPPSSTSTIKPVKPPLKLVRPVFSSGTNPCINTSFASSSSVDPQPSAPSVCQTEGTRTPLTTSSVTSSASTFSHGINSLPENSLAIGSSDPVSISSDTKSATVGNLF